jgi:sulfur-oxidizing protein SoxX
MQKIVMVVLLVLTIGAQQILADEEAAPDSMELGKAIAFDRGRGNCLACHAIEGGELMGDYGPPLLMMKTRYPDRAELRAQVWDAAVREPLTRMPPYGRHRILSEEEIDLVVDFIYTL